MAKPRERCLCCNAVLPEEKRFAYPKGCTCHKLPPGERCDICQKTPLRPLAGFCDRYCQRTFIYNNPKGLVGKLQPLRPVSEEPKPMPAEVKELLRERSREKRKEKAKRRAALNPKPANADLERKYGPMRGIKKFIEDTPGGAVRVVLVCGHNKTVHHRKQKETRCRGCKP